MKIYHTSPNLINKITTDHLFQGALFFSSTPYFMHQRGERHVYSLEVDEDMIVSVSNLYDEEAIQEIMIEMKRIGVDIDEDDAESLLDNSRQPGDFAPEGCPDYSEFGEVTWWIQGLQSIVARKQGALAVESEDEQGTVWIINLVGKEEMLKYEGRE